MQIEAFKISDKPFILVLFERPSEIVLSTKFITAKELLDLEREERASS